MPATTPNSATTDILKSTIIALEQYAMDRWAQGDPGGFLEISAEDVVYFDPFQERRLNGHEELKSLYEELRGKVHIDRYELLDPVVQCTDSMAVLTYNFVSFDKQNCNRWNCTEVFRLEPNGRWRIIQTHWSFTKPNVQFK